MLIFHAAVEEGFSHCVLVLVRTICVIMHSRLNLNPTNLIIFVRKRLNFYRKFAKN